jgi:hypothetical protein
MAGAGEHAARRRGAAKSERGCIFELHAAPEEKFLRDN